MPPEPNATAYAVSDLSDDAFVFLSVIRIRVSAISSFISHLSSCLFHLSSFITYHSFFTDDDRFRRFVTENEQGGEKTRTRIRGAPMLFADENGDRGLQIPLRRDKLLPSFRNGNPQGGRYLTTAQRI